MTAPAETERAENSEHAAKLTRLRLDSFPLPAINADDDKATRGTVLAIGGSESVPGAIVLAGMGALRAGAGTLQISSVRRSATSIAVTVPESLVIGIPASHKGEIDALQCGRLLKDRLSKANAVLIGPGMINRSNAVSLVRRLVPTIATASAVVLDGAAIYALALDEELLRERGGNSIITPHAGEMASLLEIPIDEVRENAPDVAQHCADRFSTVVVLKGGETWIARPNAPMLHYRDGKAGLGTSGSGDVLAGVITGLAARGADAMTAAAWGVWAHGSAGTKLTRSIGKIGFLASELLPEIPRLIND